MNNKPSNHKYNPNHEGAFNSEPEIHWSEPVNQLEKIANLEALIERTKDQLEDE